MSKLLSAFKGSISRRWSSRSTSTFSVAISRKNEQEPSHRYQPGGYHKVNIGDILHEKYQVSQQLGWANIPLSGWFRTFSLCLLLWCLSSNMSAFLQKAAPGCCEGTCR